MTKLIDADALKESIDEHVYLVHHGFNETEYGCTQYGIHQIIDDAPTIDAEPVRHGKWIDETFEPWGLVHHPFKCNLCGEHAEFASPYCPNCGARMDEE